MKIGLFFGTFNPVHLGHVEIVSKILNENLFNQVWVVLTPKSPHKNINLVKKEERFHMLNIAFKAYQKVLISDVEFRLKEPNYTIDTLNYLSNKFPKNTFSIIMGSDNFLKIKSWKNNNEIINKHTICVYPREGYDFKNDVNYKSVIYLNLKKIKISSTIIREKIISKEQDMAEYLPSDVWKYIHSNNLY